MNNNTNNNFNNNVNNQPINNQNNGQMVNPATQQFMQNPQMNNSVVQNNGQSINPATQQFQQPIPQQPMQNNYQQQVNNVNPNMNQMYNYNNIPNNQNNMMGNKPKNNKMLFIIIGISVVAVIAIVILILVLNNGSKNKTVNEYEDNGYQENENNNVTNTENTNETNSDTQTYKGFKFNKVSGYVYGEEEGLLIVQNSNYFVALGVTKVSFVDVKANYASLVSVLSSSGMTVGQAKCDSYNGNEVVTYEISMDGVNAIYYILSAPNSSYVYEGYVVNRTNIVDYENINLVVSIANSSTYVGDYSNYSTEFGFDFELKKMEE